MLTDVKFETFGSGAESDVVPSWQSKDDRAGVDIARNDVAENLEGLPPVKILLEPDD